jgi:hypothetical protein
MDSSMRETLTQIALGTREANHSTLGVFAPHIVRLDRYGEERGGISYMIEIKFQTSVYNTLILYAIIPNHIGIHTLSAEYFPTLASIIVSDGREFTATISVRDYM